MLGGAFNCNTDMKQFAEEHPEYSHSLLAFTLQHVTFKVRHKRRTSCGSLLKPLPITVQASYLARTLPALFLEDRLLHGCCSSPARGLSFSRKMPLYSS